MDQDTQLDNRDEDKGATQDFIGGAKCRRLDLPYHLIPTEAEPRISKRFKIGAERYGVNNWKHGDWQFILERISHLQEHVRLLKRDGNSKDDNLAAILWGGYVLAWFEEHKPKEWQMALNIINGQEIIHVDVPKEARPNPSQGIGDSGRRGSDSDPVPRFR